MIRVELDRFLQCAIKTFDEGSHVLFKECFTLLFCQRELERNFGAFLLFAEVTVADSGKADGITFGLGNKTFKIFDEFESCCIRSTAALRCARVEEGDV